MAHQANERPEWQIESLRLTCFPSPGPALPRNLDWWQQVTQQEPEQRTSNARVPSSEDEGPLDGGRLVLSVQPLRIDWLYRAAEPQALLGSMTAILPRWLEAMVGWLQMAPPLDRLAFGAGLRLPAQSRENAYAMITRLLNRHRLDIAGASDFHFQINRRRPSRSDTPNLNINRLVKWSAVRMYTVALEMGPEVTRTRATAESFACATELDMNTDANYGELPPERLTDIFRELVDLGREIAEQGDIT